MTSSPDPSDKPWLTDQRWRTGVVRSTASREMRLFVVMAVLWNAFTIPMTWLVAVPQIQEGNYAAALIGLFVLAGLWLAYSAVTSVAQWRRFGSLSLTLDPFPGALGGEVGGILEVPMDMLLREKVQVTLNCIKVTISGDQEKTRHESVVWRERGMIDPEPGRDGWRLRFRFVVPVDLPQSEPPSNNHHEWIVHVQCSLPGADLDRSFAVPVFPAESPRRSRATNSFTPHETLAQQVPPGIAQVIQNARGLSITYPLQRNRSMGVMISIFGLVFMAFPVFIVYQMVTEGARGSTFGGIFVAVGGFMALVFALVALLMLVAGVYLLGNTLQVTLGKDGVSTTRRIYGIPLRNHRDRAELIDLKARITSQQGQGAKAMVRYTLEAKTRDGKKMVLGDGVRGIAVAKHLVRVMREELGMPAEEPAQVGR